jgi:hypothetical protein
LREQSAIDLAENTYTQPPSTSPGRWISQLPIFDKTPSRDTMASFTNSTSSADSESNTLQANNESKRENALRMVAIPRPQRQATADKKDSRTLNHEAHHTHHPT